MRNHFAVAIGLVLMWSTGYSQTTKTPTKSAAQVRSNDRGIEEELVKLALEKNPVNTIAAYRSQLAHKSVRESQRAWLNTVRLQGNLNEFTLNPETSVRSMYFPRYNFSVTFSLGDFFGIPATSQYRKIEHEITKLEAESQHQLIRAEVLRLYNHYKSVRDRLTIQKKLESEMSINLELARSKFDKGNGTYEAMSELVEKHYTLQLTVLELEEALNEARINLEAVVGVDLDTVLAE